MKKLAFLSVLFIFLIQGFAQNDKKEAVLDSEEFLEECRKQLLSNCWIKLDGKLMHRDPDGKRSRPVKLKCSAQLVPNKITFKATLGGKDSYKAEHIFGQKHDTKELENTLKVGNGFDKVGIKPADLSLAFMYWDYIKEYDRDRLGVLDAYKFRVFLLANPDGKNFVKVWMSEKHKGPLQVHWLKGIKKADQENPQQVLEFKDFAEKNNVWVPLESKITNSKGELQIRFTEVDAAFSSKVPADLYKTED